MGKAGEGFKVNTEALIASGTKYRNASIPLQTACTELQGIKDILVNEMMAPMSIVEPMSEAIDMALAIIEEINKMDGKCKEIAEVYTRVERQVGKIIDALPYNVGFAPAVATTARLSIPNVFKVTNRIRVTTDLKPAKPVLLASNRLPCEGWLLNRAINATEK